MDQLISDLRYAARLLAKSPLFTLSSIAVLGIGIGASTAVFSVVDHVLLRPLALRDADRIVTVCEIHESLRGACIASTPNVLDWQAGSGTLDTIGAARVEARTLRTADRAALINVGIATPGFLPALGLGASPGRLFGEADMPPGASGHVAVLTHAFWQSEMGGVSDVLGRTVSLDGEDHQVIGVLPPGALIPGMPAADMWIPLPWDPATEEYRDWRGFRTAARLAPGARIEQAQAELEVLQSQLAASYPGIVSGWGVRVRPMQDLIVGGARPTLLMFLGAVGIVLLIVCVNMAGLLLARSSRRGLEMVVRSALGARPRRLARQLLTESLLLSVLGGVVGTLLAVWGTRVFVSLAPAGIPRIDEVSVDLRVLGFAFVVAAGTGLLSGLAPVISAKRLDLVHALREGRMRSSGQAADRARRGLVVAELALAMVLLGGAGLLIRSFTGLLDWRPGFETGHLLTFQVFPAREKYDDQERLLALYREAEVRLAALPGVASVGTASAGPLFGGGDGAASFLIEGRPDQDVTNAPSALWFDVGPGYFETLGVPLVEGRPIDERDGRGSEPVALINETMAGRFWPGASPLGATVTLPELDATVRIIGVVGDVRPFDPGSSTEPELYVSNRQRTRGATYFALRTTLDPGTLAGPVTAAIQELDVDLVPLRLRALPELAAAEVIRPRFNMLLVGLFAVIALVLAMVGVYGVIAYTVEQRRYEIGIRMALGAERTRVVRWIIREGLVMVLIGVALGLVGALAFGRFLGSMLYGVSPTDPVSIGGMVAALVLAGLAASAIPAIRASRVDPLASLRQE